MAGNVTSAVYRLSQYGESEKTFVAFKILLCIADHANREGVTGTPWRPQACLSISRIAEEARVSRRSVNDWLPKLEESGELSRTIYGTAGASHTVYKINLPIDPTEDGIELAKLGAELGAEGATNAQNLVQNLVQEVCVLVQENRNLVQMVSILVQKLGALGAEPPEVSVLEPLTGLEPVTGEREERAHTHDAPKIGPLPDSWLKANNIPSPRSESERQALAHPAVIAWLKVTNFWPSWATLPLIVERLGDCPDSGALTQVYQLWVGSGFRPGNVLGVLEWYGYRIADPNWQPSRNGRASPQPPPAMYSANQPNADGVF